MKAIFYTLVLGIVLSSCQSVKFNRYPGEALPEFPENFRGKYTSINKNTFGADTVSVWIATNAYTIFNAKETTIDFLDSLHVFSKYQKNYFLFVKENEYWSGFAVARTKKGMEIIPFAIPASSDSTKVKKSLSKYFTNVFCIPSTNKIEGETYFADMNEKSLLKYIRKNKRYKMNLIQDKE